MVSCTVSFNQGYVRTYRRLYQLGNPTVNYMLFGQAPAKKWLIECNSESKNDARIKGANPRELVSVNGEKCPLSSYIISRT